MSPWRWHWRQTSSDRAGVRWAGLTIVLSIGSGVPVAARFRRSTCSPPGPWHRSHEIPRPIGASNRSATPGEWPGTPPWQATHAEVIWRSNRWFFRS